MDLSYLNSNIDAAPVGLSRSVKKIVKHKVPNLGSLTDISEFVTGYLSFLFFNWIISLFTNLCDRSDLDVSIIDLIFSEDGYVNFVLLFVLLSFYALDVCKITKHYI